MPKTQEKSICPICKQKTAIKYGKQRGVQKYYCQNCRQYVLDKRPKYSNKTKKFLSMLANFLKFDFNEKIDIREAIAQIDEKVTDVNDFEIITNKIRSSEQLICKNPCFLMCLEDKKIVLYSFDRRTLRNTDNCSFTIVHDKNHSN